MKIFPRHKWISHVVRSNPGSDIYTGLPYYRAKEPVGIVLMDSGVDTENVSLNPVDTFKGLFHEAVNLGRSDIAYNLGVTTNTSGVWNLRGIHNKSTAEFDPVSNSSYLSVYCVLGKNEKPTDQLLRNILDARRLVLSRYPGATTTVVQTKNFYLQQILKKEVFWKERLLPPVESIPSLDLVEISCSEGMQSVHVQELQEQLAFFGYYKIRVDGVYNVQTVDAVRELQVNLHEAGLFHYEWDGVYTEHVHRAWVKQVESFS